jgi:hypothetical protein
VSAVDLVAVADMPATGAASQPAEATEVEAPEGIVDEPAADVPVPLVGPLTVDQAVDAMLKAPGRFDAGAGHEPAGLAPPVEAPTAGAATTAEPVDEAEPAAAPAPFVLEVPEFTVAPRAPGPSDEPAPVAETAAAIAEPSDPEPHVLSAEVDARTVDEPAAPVAPQADEPPAPLAQAPSPLVIPEPLPGPDAEAPPAVAPTAAPPAASAPSPVPRHPTLAAITALSDEEKIALFS